MVFDDDIAAAMLRDFGEPIGTTGFPESVRHPERVGALLERDIVQTDVAGGGELIRALVLEFRSGVLGSLTRDQIVTVSGVRYRLLWRAAGLLRRSVAGPLEQWAVAPA